MNPTYTVLCTFAMEHADFNSTTEPRLVIELIKYLQQRNYIWKESWSTMKIVNEWYNEIHD